MKRHCVTLLFLLSSFYLFCDKQIGTVPLNCTILQSGVIEDNVPVLSIIEKREGLISIIEERFVIIGKEKLGPFDNVRSFIFSPNGKTVAFQAKINGKWYLYEKDKKRVGPFDEIRIPMWNEKTKIGYFYDDSSLIYSTRVNHSCYIYAGSKKIGPFNTELIWDLFLYPDKKTIAFYFYADNRIGYVHVGTNIFGPFNHIDSIYSPDRQAIAFLCYPDINGESYYYVVGEQQIGPFDYHDYRVGSFSFSLEGKAYAYSRKINGKWYVFVDKEKVGPFDNVYDVAISPNGDAVAFSVQENGKNYLVAERKWIELPKEQSAYDIHFSPDGKALTYCIDNGRWREVNICIGENIIGRKEIFGPFNQASQHEPWFEFSPDYKTFALTEDADDGVYLVVGREKAGPFNSEYDVSNIAFSSDSKVFSYVIRVDDNSVDYNHYFFVKNKRFGPFHGFIGNLWFSNDNTVSGFSNIIDSSITSEKSIGYIVLDGNIYTGSICGNNVIYIKDNKIMLR